MQKNSLKNLGFCAKISNFIDEIIQKEKININKTKEEILNDISKILREIPAISYYEIKRGLLKTNDIEKLKRFNSFCSKHNLIFIDNIDILNIASEIYAYLNKKGQLIGDADILIAAMTMSKNFILVTNDKDFARIENLKIENWL